MLPSAGLDHGKIVIWQIVGTRPREAATWAGGVERAAECHAGRVLQTQVEIFGIVRVRERSGPGAEAELGGDSLMDLASDGLYHGEIVRGWMVVT